MRKMNRFKLILFLAAILCTLAAISAVPRRADAKAGKTTKKAVSLAPGKTYKSYDVTGDGKADKLKYTSKHYSEGTASGNVEYTFFVNGKKKQIIEAGRGGGVWLMAPAKNQSFLVVGWGMFGASGPSVYKYKNGKFRSCYKKFLGEDVLDYAEPYKVAKTGFSVIISAGKHQRDVVEPSYELSHEYPSFVINYKIKNGKISLKSRYGKAVGENTYTVEKPFNTSTKAAVNGYDGPMTRLGDSVKLTRIYIRKDGTVAYEAVINGTETGWITPENVYGMEQYLMF